MSITQAELSKVPSDVQALIDRVPQEYLHDLALDLAWAALAAPRRPDALHQVAREWEITLEEIALDGDDLPEVLLARKDARTGM